MKELEITTTPRQVSAVSSFVPDSLTVEIDGKAEPLNRFLRIDKTGRKASVVPASGKKSVTVQTLCPALSASARKAVHNRLKGKLDEVACALDAHARKEGYRAKAIAMTKTGDYSVSMSRPSDGGTKQTKQTDRDRALAEELLAENEMLAARLAELEAKLAA